MFRVWIEYYNREEVEMCEVTKADWFNRLYEELENDDEVEHYGVETIEL